MSHETVKSHILVTASVPEEAEGIKARMSAMTQKKIGGRCAFEGSIGRVAVRLVETGPGMVNTAQSLAAAIESLPPAMILMTGCGGGFARAGMNVGDIGVAVEENDAHLGIAPEVDGQPPAPIPFDLEVVDGVGIRGRIPMDGRLTDEARTVLKAEFSDPDVNVLQGPFVTVATVTATDLGADRIYQRFYPCMENMEGTAGAHVAIHYGIPFLEIRCASNLVGKRKRHEWDLPLACRRSAEAAVTWIRYWGTVTGEP